MKQILADPKYLDKYTFSSFEEEVTQARTFVYEAKDPELFTQKLQITADMFNNKIRNVYIETRKNTFWSKQSQKLFYAPVKVLQIQQHTEPLIGGNKDLIIEYNFRISAFSPLRLIV